MPRAILLIVPEPRPWLPSESTPASTPGAVFLTLALTILSLLALNIAAGHLLDKAGRNLGYRLMDQKWALARSPGEFSPGSVVLVLGDSSGNQGVDPAALADALSAQDPGASGQSSSHAAMFASPPRVLNLCTVADALAVHDAWILAEWIKLHGPPAGVVLVHTYDVWWRQPNTNLATSATLARVPVPLWNWASLRPAIVFSPEHWANLLAARWTPLYAQDASLRELLADPSTAWSRYTTRAGMIWQTVDANGFLSVSQGRPQGVLRDTRAHLGFLRAHLEPRQWTRFRMSPDNAAGLEELARLAEQHRFPLWIAAAPMYRGLWESRAMRAYHADLRAWFEAFERDHPTVRVVLPQPTPFEAQQMQNADHVIESAAEQYARLVGDAIRRTTQPAP